MVKTEKYYPRLREIRIAYGKPQKDIASFLKITPCQYNRYEHGERELPMHHFISLAKYYNVSLDYLAGLSN